MMMLIRSSILSILFSLSVARFALSSPTSRPPIDGLPWNDPPTYNSSVRPLVLWHGMGDSANSAGMLQFADFIRGVHPGIYIHNIYIEEELDKDQRAGFFGNVWEQIELVNAQLNALPELKNGFDALGFSQGGQFLRAYVEKYNSPPVGNLITFGSQHMGVSDLPTCRPGDLLCYLARAAAKRGVYSSYAQTNIVQAQYFRDHARLPLYYETNMFLTVINGEVESTRNETYARNLAGLRNLVLVIFDRDTTVVPRESSWFGSFTPPEEDQSWWGDEVVLPMRDQPLYKEDWIGLRELDERGGVAFVSCDGEHMQITKECWLPIVAKYVGGLVGDIDSGATEGSRPPSRAPLVLQSTS